MLTKIYHMIKVKYLNIVVLYISFCMKIYKQYYETKTYILMYTNLIYIIFNFLFYKITKYSHIIIKISIYL